MTNIIDPYAIKRLNYIRAALDRSLCVPNLLNLRPYTISLVTRTSTALPSGRKSPGTGIVSETDFVLYNGPTYPDGYTLHVSPRYRQVDMKDVVLGGVLRDVTAKIGPFVFPYTTDDGYGVSGGIDPLMFSVASGVGTELFLKISGPNYPEPILYKKFSAVTDKNVMYYVYVHATGN